MAGTIILTTAQNPNTVEIGRIMPGIGLTLIPVKEGVALSKVQEQNTATQVRAKVRRLEYVPSENRLSGERNIEVLMKTKIIQDELRKSRLQFVDLPMVEFGEKFSEADADKLFSGS